VDDIQKDTAAMRGTSNLVMVFVYGFVAMLTLIGLTSVVSTVSTNLRSRRREFAVLRSNGLTPGGMNKILTMESLICGGRALLFGIPIAVVSSYVLYRSMGDVILAPFRFPWWPVLACIVSVLGITLVTMRLSSRSLREGSIVESIRGLD
jgi:putative ABC transport system permease protein